MRWLPLYMILLLVSGLSPMILRCSPAPLWTDPEAGDIVRNLLFLLPLGIALRRRPLLWTILAATAVSVGIEAAQTWLFRSANLLDVGANVLGAVTGWIVTRRRPGLPDVILRPAHGLTLLVLAAGFAVVGVRSEPPVNDFSNWEPMPLSVGKEPDGSRAWNGVLERFAVYDNVEREGEPLATGPVGALDPARFQRTGEVSIVARFRLDAAPSGHGRIVTCSRDPFIRCFTLGVHDRFLVWRVRTPSTGLNGTLPQLETREPLPLGEDVEVVATFDGTWSRLLVNGRCHDDLLLPAVHAPVMIGNGVLVLVAAVAASAGLGLAAFGRKRRVLLLIVGATAGVTLLVVLGATSTVPVGPVRVIATAFMVTCASIPLVRPPTT